MKKLRIVSLLLALLMVPCMLMSAASADTGSTISRGSMSWDETAQAYLYGEDHYGIVLCTRITVRDRASTSGASLAKLTNGQPVKILGITQNNTFYLLDPETCGITDTARYPYGYVKADLIKMDPTFLAATKTLNLYATPWSSRLKNGEQGDRFFLVIDQYEGWYAVQNKESNPGTSFIRTRDVTRYNTTLENLQVVVWDAPLYDALSWAQINTVKRFTVGRVDDSNGAYTLMVFNAGTSSEYSGWIPSHYVAPLVN